MTSSKLSARATIQTLAPVLEKLFLPSPPQILVSH